MNKINTSDISLCQKSLKRIQDSLLLAIESQNAEALVDVLLSTQQHFALCAEKGLYLAIDKACNTIYQTLKSHEKTTWGIISNSGISSEIIGILSKTIGQNLTRTILRATSSYNNDYTMSLADESAIFKVSMQEVLLMAKPDYSTIRLSNLSKDGNHQCIVDAIEFFSKCEDGAIHLAHVDLWRALRNYKPSRNTKQNFLKLPDNIKRALKKHEALATEAYRYVRQHQNHAACTPWVVRELFEFGIKDLAYIILKDCLNIHPNPNTPDGINFHFPDSCDRTYRIISLMDQMGYVETSDGFAEHWLKLATHGHTANLNQKMCAIDYLIENPGISATQFAGHMKSVFSDFENDYPDTAVQYLVTLLFELRRNIPTSNCVAQEKINTLSNHIGHLFGEFKRGAQTARLSMENRNGADIIDEITSSHGFKRGSLITDLGM